MPPKSTKVTLNCANCGIEFAVKRHRAGTIRHCSNRCRWAAKAIPVICEHCGKTFQTCPSAAEHAHYCSQGCKKAHADVLLEARWLKNVDPVIQPFGCMFYTGYVDNDGYGTFRFNDRSMGAHQFSYLREYGAIPDGAIMMHLCSAHYAPGDFRYRRCVNPVHLRPGSHAENIKQRDQEGRTAKGERSAPHMHPEIMRRGEGHPKAILTATDVWAIRSRDTGQRGIRTALALEFGVARCTINDILNRRSWKHI